VMTFSASALAERICSALESAELQTCVEIPSSTPECNLQENKIMEHVGTNSDTPLQCSDSEIFEGGAKKSKKEISALKNDYNKLCKKKAKEYKRAVTKHLMQEMKLGQAFQALLKKKQYSTKFNNGKPEKPSVSVNPNDLENMSAADLNNHILNELEKKFPGLRDMANKAKDKPAYKYGFHESETVPLNVVFQKQKGKACTVNLSELPEKEDFTPAACDFCEEKDIKNSFVDDCAYMVSKDYPEKSAQQLLNLKAANKNEYCQPSMDNRDSDMAEINKMAKRLCDIAKSGMTPDFTIETSRNLYADKTQDLAQKRGDFIQKYLQNKLKSDCELSDTPSWLSNEEVFAEKIRVTHPEYVGSSQAGDYGPSPYAGIEEQPAQIENFQKTLLLEKQKIEKRIQDSEALLAKLMGEKNNIVTAANDHKKAYKENKLQLEKSQDLRKISSGYQELEQTSNIVQNLYNRTNELDQKISDTNREVQGLRKQLQNYSENKMSEKVKLLQDFYQEKNAKGTPNKAEWDQKLFNDFKMVKISGKAKEESAIDSDTDLLSPELSIALNTLVEIDTFTCVVKPISTSKVSLEGILKGSGKAIMSITAPLAGAAALGGAIVAMPFTTGASLICKGCGKPGETMPSWMAYGNLTTLNMNKSARRNSWKETKRYLDDYVTLGGRLNVKSQKNSTTHDNFDALAEEYYGDDFQNKSKQN
jgi:hypothetical protein